MGLTTSAARAADQADRALPLNFGTRRRQVQ
jgi:hypothetical protein